MTDFVVPDDACPRCRARGKTWNGSDPICGFSNGVFDRRNWACATLGELRALSDPVYVNDTHILLIDVDDDEGSAMQLLLRWYKQRGSVEAAYLWPWNSDPEPLTLERAEYVIAMSSSVRQARTVS